MNNLKKPLEIKAYSKKQLADMYEISPDTFRRWIIAANIFNEAYYKGLKILKPKEVRRIFEEFGEP